MVAFAELLTANRFYLELKLDGGNDTVDATFLECQGFKRSQEAIAICEVTPQQWGRAKSGRAVDTKIPGSAKTENIILRRGMTHSMTLWNWFDAVETGSWAKQLRDGAVSIYDQAGQVRARFEFRGAWPTRYTAADLGAQSTELEIEELEMVVESFIRKK
ncbi:MAG: phage tail protein [Elainellaceae cyanobacterium]